MRNRDSEKACLGQLPDILVRSVASILVAARQIGSFVAAVQRIWSRRALSIYRIERRAVRANGDGIGIPPSGDETEDPALTPLGVVPGSPISAKLDDGQIVSPSVRDVEPATVGRNGKTVGR